MNRIFYAAGPGNIIRVHQHWMRDEPDPTQLPTAYSSEFCDFCRDIEAEAYVISSHHERQVLRDGPITLEHRPKIWPGASSLFYHLREILYALSLVMTAVRFRANWAVLHSGSTHFFAMSVFRLMGIRTVVMLHNTLWPAGFPPKRPVQRLITRLNSMFFQWAATATVGVSPECIRQVKQLTRGRHKAVYEMRPYYRRQTFETIPLPAFDRNRPFQILWSGRMDAQKGALEVLTMAYQFEQRWPCRVQWHVVGGGPMVTQFQLQRKTMELDAVVTYYGEQLPDRLCEIIGTTHATIVPTRSVFAEGLAKTAVESVLSGRPVITNRVVPALEVLRPACLEAEPDDVESYVELILDLSDDRDRYRQLCGACSDLQQQFYDGKLRMRKILLEVINAQA
jgi:glycogen synthase